MVGDTEDAQKQLLPTVQNSTKHKIFSCLVKADKNQTISTIDLWRHQKSVNQKYSTVEMEKKEKT